MIQFQIDRYEIGDARALRRALGRRRPARRAVSWALRLLLLAAGALFGLTAAFFWVTLFASGRSAALRPGSNDLAVAVVCHGILLLTLVPALGYGPWAVRRLLRMLNRQAPLTAALEGDQISLELPRWTDALPYPSVEAVLRVRGRWILFLKNRRVLVLPERCLTGRGPCSLEAFLEGRGITCLGGGDDGI